MTMASLEPAKDAIDHARQLCKDHFDMFDAPKVQLHCDPKLTFMYIPSHLHHILFELLKNSLRGTVTFIGHCKFYSLMP